jgi:predicted metal-dependent hydrolase
MNPDALLDDLRNKSVALEVRGLTLRVAAPREVVTEELHEIVSRHKHALSSRHLERERKRLEEAERRGLLIKWSREPGYVALHDPTTGEWHDVPASGCLPSIVEIAKTHRQRRRQSR